MGISLSVLSVPQTRKNLQQAGGFGRGSRKPGSPFRKFRKLVEIYKESGRRHDSGDIPIQEENQKILHHIRYMFHDRNLVIFGRGRYFDRFLESR